jgi:hypothetical protein
MKRTGLFILILTITSGMVFSQKLLDIYKNGPVKLVPETSYGSKNNWTTLFNLYYDTIKKDVARRWNDKKIIIAPDGSVFMNHMNRHEIWKFGPDGTFLKKFGTKGGKANQFPMLPTVQGVVDGKYVFTDDVNARLKFFDMDGNYFKSITLKYMTRKFQPTTNGDILLTGWVLWRTQKPGLNTPGYNNRTIVVRLNLYSGEEKIIYSAFENEMTRLKDSIYDNSTVGLIGGKYLPGYMTLKRPEIVLLTDGRFMILDQAFGKVDIYDKTGKRSGGFQLDITPLKITEQDALENYESVRQTLLKSIKLAEAMPDTSVKKVSKGERGTKPGTLISAYPNKYEIINRAQDALTKIEKLKDVNYYFPHLPYFSNIISDDEGNLLVFEYTNRDEKSGNIFNVIAYDNNGRKLARTSFICEDYDLSFSESTFVISKGYVYAVAKLKNTTGMPLRLVKFKITN